MRTVDTTFARERLAWTAVVAVLATALAWLAVVNLCLLLAASASQLASDTMLVAGALLEAGRAVLRSLPWATPFALAVLAAGAIALVALLVEAARPSKRLIDRGARHA